MRYTFTCVQRDRNPWKIIHPTVFPLGRTSRFGLALSLIFFFYNLIFFHRVFSWITCVIIFFLNSKQKLWNITFNIHHVAGIGLRALHIHVIEFSQWPFEVDITAPISQTRKPRPTEWKWHLETGQQGQNLNPDLSDSIVLAFCIPCSEHLIRWPFVNLYIWMFNLMEHFYMPCTDAILVCHYSLPPSFPERGHPLGSLWAASLPTVYVVVPTS